MSTDTRDPAGPPNDPATPTLPNPWEHLDEAGTGLIVEHFLTTTVSRVGNALRRTITVPYADAFQITVTEWRTHFRRTMNDMDSKANQKAIDSLLNFETVKYFGNEAFEASRYDQNLVRYQAAAVKSQKSLAVLNFGQQTIIAVGLVLILWRATLGVIDGSMTLGDLVLVNTLMIQLYIPLNFLGVIYREIKQALTDMDRMFSLLNTEKEIADAPNATSLLISNQGRGPDVRFENVSFHYDAKREILKDVSFNIPAGTITAVVGQSGAGKSTLLKGIVGLEPLAAGKVLINDTDITHVPPHQRVGLGVALSPEGRGVFADQTVYENLLLGAYSIKEDDGRVQRLVELEYQRFPRLRERANQLAGTLSGGEQQMLAISRALMSEPKLLLLDEPSLGLAPLIIVDIFKSIRALRDAGLTILLVEQMANQALAVADRAYVLETGRIILEGTGAQLLKDPAVRAAYLGSH